VIALKVTDPDEVVVTDLRDLPGQPLSEGRRVCQTFTGRSCPFDRSF
jgi:hypothetical protein